MSAPSSSPLTVVVVNDFCLVQGGASKVAIDEAVALAHAGVRVIFFGAVGPVCTALREAPLEVVCLEQAELLEAKAKPWVVLQGLWNATAHARMRQVLAPLDRRSTLVHVHGYTKAVTTSPIRAAAAAGFRLVCTLHDFFAACPNGAFFDYGTMTPCTRRALSPACLARNCDKRRYAHKLFRVVRAQSQRQLGRFPGAVRHYIALSRHSAALLRPYLPADSQVHPLGNVIDVAAQPPVAVAANRAVFCVGRLDEEKGVRLLAAAARQAGVPLVFVGDGPLRATLQSICDAEITGWLPAAEVLVRLRAARCLVFPSLWYETYGLVVSEAAALGIPAIVSDVTAAAERVIDGATGWHFRSGDSGDLARCLGGLTDAAVTAMGRAAYASFWADPPTQVGHVRDLRQIYRAILASPHAATDSA